MKFCKQCGSKLESDKKFCASCGTPLNGSELTKSSNYASVQPDNKKVHSSKQMKEPAQKEPMSAQKKRIVIISSAIAGVLAIFYFVGSYFTSEERLVKSFSDAVYQQDAGKMADLLSYRNPELEISSQQAQAFMKYLEEYPGERDYLVQTVEQQAKFLNQNQAVAGEAEAFMGGNSVLNLEQDGNFFMFDRYKLFVEPIYFTWETDYAGTKLYQGETELAEASENEFTKKVGPFLTGVHTFSSQYKGDYIDLNKEEEIELTPYDMNRTFNLSVDAEVMQFDSAIDPSIPSRLIVNDKTVDFNVFSGESYGPVTFDGSMEIAVEADFPWGTAKTEAVPLEESYFNVEFDMDKKLQEELVQSLNTYNVSYGEALNKNDVTLLKNSSEDLKEDFTYEAILFHDTDEEYVHQEEVTSLEMDTRTLELTSTDSELEATVYVREKVEKAYYRRDSEPELVKGENSWQYDLIYQDGEWIVNHKTKVWDHPADFEESTDIITEPIFVISKTEV